MSRTLLLLALPMLLADALAAEPAVSQEAPAESGAASVQSAQQITAADLAGAAASRYDGQRVWISGELVRLGNAELDDDFGVADRTGIASVDLLRDLLENPDFVADLMHADRVVIAGVVRASGDSPSDGPGPQIEVERIGDIVFVAQPPYREAALGLAAFGVILLIVHLLSRQRNAERRAREMSLFSRELHRRDAILEAISFMAERFLRSPTWEESLPQALERLGLASAAGRVTVHQARRDTDGPLEIAVLAEWVDTAVDSNATETPFIRVNIDGLGLAAWVPRLLRNEVVVGTVATFPEAERAYLESRGIRSILVIPIPVGDAVWGVLVFADHTQERQWTGTESEVLVAAAGMIGAAVERVRAVAALIEVEDRFRQMAEHIREVFFMTDVETCEVLYLSPAYEEVWGRSRAETMANPLAFTDSIVPEDRHLMLSDIDRSADGSGETERQFEYRIERPDGTIRWIRNRSFQIRDGAGKPYRVAGVCTDITDQKLLEEGLRTANRIEAMGHLAAGIAHEINTPVQYIGGNLEFLEASYGDLCVALDAYGQLLAESTQGPVPPERLAAITRTVEAADIGFIVGEAPRATAQALEGVRRVSEIVRAMKEFSHPGTGQRIPTDLNQAIRSTTTVARNEWKYVAELVTDLDESLPMVSCFPGEVNQAILNLVVNAAHAISDRHNAEGIAEPGTITISTRHVRGFVEIRVSDTGTGIPEEIRPRIFDPFFTTKEVGRGTGQGLTFVHTIVVEKHGGTVSFDTEPGEGTTFVVRLPHRARSTVVREAA